MGWRNAVLVLLLSLSCTAGFSPLCSPLVAAPSTLLKQWRPSLQLRASDGIAIARGSFPLRMVAVPDDMRSKIEAQANQYGLEGEQRASFVINQLQAEIYREQALEKERRVQALALEKERREQERSEQALALEKERREQERSEQALALEKERSEQALALEKERSEQALALEKERSEKALALKDKVNAMDKVASLEGQNARLEHDFVRTLVMHRSVAILATRNTIEIGLRNRHQLLRRPESNFTFTSAAEEFVHEFILNGTKLRTTRAGSADQRSAPAPAQNLELLRGFGFTAATKGVVLALEQLTDRLSTDLHIKVLDKPQGQVPGIYVGGEEPIAQAAVLVVAELQARGFFSYPVMPLNSLRNCNCILSEGQIGPLT